MSLECVAEVIGGWQETPIFATEDANQVITRSIDREVEFANAEVVNPVLFPEFHFEGLFGQWQRLQRNLSGDQGNTRIAEMGRGVGDFLWRSFGLEAIANDRFEITPIF